MTDDEMREALLQHPRLIAEIEKLVLLKVAEVALRVVNDDCPYDGRTKEGRAWFAGARTVAREVRALIDPRVVLE